eukprot:2057421-Pleurochrysis_carterae.AAC.1
MRGAGRGGGTKEDPHREAHLRRVDCERTQPRRLHLQRTARGRGSEKVGGGGGSRSWEGRDRASVSSRSRNAAVLNRAEKHLA